MRPKEDEFEKRQSMGHTALAVALTCRQVYLEAAPRYYSRNTFAVHTGTPMTSPIIQDFFADVGPANKDTIAKLELADFVAFGDAHLENLKGCKILTLLATWKERSMPEEDYRERWIRLAKRICKNSTTLERVSILTHYSVRMRTLCWISRRTFRSLTGSDQGDKAVERELNMMVGRRQRGQQ